MEHNRLTIYLNIRYYYFSGLEWSSAQSYFYYCWRFETNKLCILSPIERVCCYWWLGRKTGHMGFSEARKACCTTWRCFDRYASLCLSNPLNMHNHISTLYILFKMFEENIYFLFLLKRRRT